MSKINNLFILLISLFMLNKVKSVAEYIRAFHLDCGRKYFTVDEIKSIIDLLSEYNYNYLELALGNDGMRFLLNDMTIESKGKTYSSEDVRTAINQGNKNYYDAGENNELTEDDMEEIITYATKKKINILPLLNSPGHMDSILYAAETLTGTTCRYEKSVRTIDITNEVAVDFTQKIIELYVKYFAKKGMKYFNIGSDEYANDIYSSGFQHLINAGKYGYLIKYINENAEIVESYGLKCVSFNDPFYYNNVKEAKVGDKTYELKKSITLSYWSCGWTGYDLAKASTLLNAGFSLLNTNGNWYYIFGRTVQESNLKNIKYHTLIGEGRLDVVGCMICAWSDDPWVKYGDDEKSNINKLISIFSEANVIFNPTNN